MNPARLADCLGTAEADVGLQAEWAFILALYARPGVAPACLQLQDRLGLDVMVLLHALYRDAACGTPADAAAIARLDAAVLGWRTRVVGVLRLLRRELGTAAVAPVPAPLLQQTRTLIGQAELGAELGALALLDGVALERVDACPPDARAQAQRVLAHYAARCGAVVTPACAQAADLVADAACSVGVP